VILDFRLSIDQATKFEDRKWKIENRKPPLGSWVFIFKFPVSILPFRVSISARALLSRLASTVELLIPDASRVNLRI
jgi:hypothetical protein